MIGDVRRFGGFLPVLCPSNPIYLSIYVSISMYVCIDTDTTSGRVIFGEMFRRVNRVI